MYLIVLYLCRIVTIQQMIRQYVLFFWYKKHKKTIIGSQQLLCWPLAFSSTLIMVFNIIYYLESRYAMTS